MGRRVTPTLVDPINGPNANTLKMSEEELQGGVIDLARLQGWRVAHFRPARTEQGWRTPVAADGKGFPDLLMLRHPRLLVVELKSDRGRMTPEQEQWMHDWMAFAGTLHVGLEVGAKTEIGVHIWTPGDWLTRKIHAELERR